MTRIRVAFDREIFLLQNFGGVSKSFVKHIANLEKMDNLNIEPLLTFSRTKNKHLLEYNSGLTSRLLPARKFLQPKSSVQTLLTLGPVRSALSRFSGGENPVQYADIFHATYYRPQNVDKRDVRKLVVTVHDYIPEYLGWTGIRNPHIGKSQLIKKADLIVCVSEVTKQAMIENIGFSPDNVRVIPHGTEFVDRNHENVGTFTILYVGHRRGYKNYQLLIQALHGLEKYREYKLILAGPNLELEERTYLDSMIRDRWLSIVDPSDRDLQKLYSEVSIHCVTSKMEGFGMTAIEAIGAACPVIATRIPIFQESLAEHGVLVDVQDPSELREVIKTFMLNENYYGEIQKSLFDIRLRYSWESRTTDLANAYKEILG